MADSRKTNWERIFLYGVLATILAICLWVGWSDFDPRVPQNEVRESIQSAIRRVLQICIKYVAPVAILAFFAKEIFGRARNDGSENKSQRQTK